MKSMFRSLAVRLFSPALVLAALAALLFVIPAGRTCFAQAAAQATSYPHSPASSASSASSSAASFHNPPALRLKTSSGNDVTLYSLNAIEARLDPSLTYLNRRFTPVHEKALFVETWKALSKADAQAERASTDPKVQARLGTSLELQALARIGKTHRVTVPMLHDLMLYGRLVGWDRGLRAGNRASQVPPHTCGVCSSTACLPNHTPQVWGGTCDTADRQAAR